MRPTRLGLAMAGESTRRDRPPPARGIPRSSSRCFLVVLFAVAVATHMDLQGLISDSIVRVGRNGI